MDVRVYDKELMEGWERRVLDLTWWTSQIFPGRNDRQRSATHMHEELVILETFEERTTLRYYDGLEDVGALERSRRINFGLRIGLWQRGKGGWTLAPVARVIPSPRGF